MGTKSLYWVLAAFTAAAGLQQAGTSQAAQTAPGTDRLIESCMARRTLDTFQKMAHQQPLMAGSAVAQNRTTEGEKASCHLSATLGQADEPADSPSAALPQGALGRYVYLSGAEKEEYCAGADHGEVIETVVDAQRNTYTIRACP